MNYSSILGRSKSCYSLTEQSSKIKKSEVRYSILNDFHVPKKLIKSLKTYLVLHWESDFLFSIIEDGTVERDGIDYIAIFHRCTYYQAKHSKQVHVSFREPNKEFELPAYVLIKIGE